MKTLLIYFIMFHQLFFAKEKEDQLCKLEEINKIYSLKLSKPFLKDPV